jgi:2-hydroxycyclohexanecarboxyl-CoA dehydrogenase
MIGNPGNTSYNVTKEAIRALTRTAANEWGRYNIVVNTLNPTLRTDAFTAWEKARPETVAAIIDATPLRRLGDPIKDGVPLAVFLASDGNSYMTGMTFQLGGGRIMP